MPRKGRTPTPTHRKGPKNSKKRVSFTFFHRSDLQYRRPFRRPLFPQADDKRLPWLFSEGAGVSPAPAVGIQPIHHCVTPLQKPRRRTRRRRRGRNWRRLLREILSILRSFRRVVIRRGPLLTWAAGRRARRIPVHGRRRLTPGFHFRPNQHTGGISAVATGPSRTPPRGELPRRTVTGDSGRSECKRCRKTHN